MGKFKKGDWVEYHRKNDRFHDPQGGRVKRVSEDNKKVFVVFSCNDQWGYFEDYTAAGCPIGCLEHVEVEIVSNCCSAPIIEDMGMCSDCKDHCAEEFII